MKILSGVSGKQLFRFIVILIFIEKVVTANAKADPLKNIRKQKYLFESNIQHVWDCLPKEDVDSEYVSSSLKQIYFFASRRDAVCVRTLLNTSLVLLNHLKDLVGDNFPSTHLLSVESAIFEILKTYDPEIKHDESQAVGSELADEILTYLESL
jgi:hypothetical protein